MPPKPGMMPRLISGWPKVADSAAMRTSQAIASSQPPPNASALTAAIVAIAGGLHRAQQARASSSSSSLPAAASIFVNALMSAPAQNSIGFAEAMTSARIVPARSTSSHTLRSAATDSGEIEFAGGLSSQAIAISPRVSSLTGLSSQPASGCA